MRYDRRTRERILGRVAEQDGYVQCHSHDMTKNICCRGFWDALGDEAHPIRLARRFESFGLGTIEHVTPGMYPRDDDEQGYDDGENYG